MPAPEILVLPCPRSRPLLWLSPFNLLCPVLRLEWCCVQFWAKIPHSETTTFLTVNAACLTVNKVLVDWNPRSLLRFKHSSILYGTEPQCIWRMKELSCYTKSNNAQLGNKIDIRNGRCLSCLIWTHVGAVFAVGLTPVPCFLTPVHIARLWGMWSGYRSWVAFLLHRHMHWSL